MIPISHNLMLDEREVEFSMIRAQGAGGQNVNKVSSAVHLRFDIRASSLPDDVKHALLGSGDRRITKDGVAIIKAQTHRSQDKNRAEAIERLAAMIASAARPVTPRKPTRPTRASQQRRVQRKVRHGQIKLMRGKIGGDAG
ncbi:alternative ribosome rescue aminoacyl-tRNA hydrolase ArfB [Bordetella genomosp. 11]|uniref:Aminoacyl-tRNA hydrolase n=1 Tax=Bordetella genomosp. 11 TaxID=1416808 RepID=A0A261UG34_9BORD|nr:alternative ribosome rescue aminoacyl-tRNA hydrolase ArfB [Bordetella genomosp. 11]OZI60160.1 aminoacyl-tRNA hydrolase [Bordetella genomosp. 11]